MTPSVFNLLASLPAARDAEVSQILLTGKGVRFERIISLGQASPEGFWYDQEEAELVIVLAGPHDLPSRASQKAVSWDPVMLSSCRSVAVTAWPGPIPTIRQFGWHCSLTQGLNPPRRDPWSGVMHEDDAALVPGHLRSQKKHL
jgi:hypothetical protein